MAGSSKKPRRYSGDLNKPFQVSQSPKLLIANCLQDLAEQGMIVSNTEVARTLRDELQTEYNQQVIGEFDRLLILLFDHYLVAHGDFHGLALALANAHVPAFQRPAIRGRPKSLQKQLWEALRVAHPRSPGRPPAMSDGEETELVRAADIWKADQRARGVQRPSDQGFLLYMIRGIARKNRVRESEVRRALLGTFNIRLSKARRRLSKTE